MKKLIILVLFLISNSYCQVRIIESGTYFKQGNFEINFSTSLGAGFSKTNTTYTNEYVSYYDSTSYSNVYNSEISSRDFLLSFTASLGYYFMDAISFEPEFDLNLLTYDDISISIIANLTYTFSTSNNKIYPYIKLGYGISNYVSNYNNYNDPGNNSLDTQVLNAAFGMKQINFSGSSFRWELSYKYYSHSNSYTYTDQYSYNTSITDVDSGIDVISFSVGYSFNF